MQVKHLKTIKILLWIAFGASILFFIISSPEKSFANYLFTLGISLLYTFGYSIPNGILNDFLDQKYPWIENTKKRAVLAIFGAVLLNVLLTYVLNYINFVVIQGLKSEVFFSDKWNFTNWFFINLALLISSFLHARGFMIAMKQNAKEEVIEQKIIAKSANAQFESLKNQLDPHFLFNSLNVLSALIDENPNQAQRFTSSMSKIYRYVLDQKDKELVTVEEEMDFAKTYGELLKTRFEDSVNFEFSISEDIKNQYVVPLSLQLLLENAIKHNFATSQKPLNIKVYSENQQLIIENNLQAREVVKEREGIGLTNIVQRYSLLTKLHVYIEKSQEFFKVKIPILKEKISTMDNTQHLKSQEILAYEKATRRVKELKDFYGNLISYSIFIPFMFFINWRTSPNYWWAFWPMFGWGIGLAIHALKTFGIGKDWEERQIKKYMEKNN